MHARPTAFDSETPVGAHRPIIRRNPDCPQEIEMIAAVWGSEPRFGDGVSWRFVRAEGRHFPARRCLIPASEFHLAAGGVRYRATLDGGNFFYLAGVWEPALTTSLPSFRIVTIPASEEVARYQSRHGAIIHRRQVMQWLDHTVPDDELLATPPARTFTVEKFEPSFALDMAS